jgi:transcriptional regulator with GAF, ATPase, and Fis domain
MSHSFSQSTDTIDAIKEESMKSISTWESERLVNAVPNVNGNGAAGHSNITTLKELTLRLLREVQAITEVRTLSLESGVDFYSEVSRFEVDLIKRALLQTAGHQGRAARLLNLKVTTLNSKIKHYNIALNGFANGYPLVETGEMETRSPI